MKYKPVPSLDKWIESQNGCTFNSELRGQMETVYGLFAMKLPSCFVEGIQHSIFEVASLNGIDFKDVGWDTEFKCPFTGYGMKCSNSFFGGPPMWVPKKIPMKELPTHLPNHRLYQMLKAVK